MVVLKWLISNNFYFERIWWSWKDWFSTSSSLEGHAGLERTGFRQFPLWEDVVVLKALILCNFYLGGCGTLKGLIFWTFSLWEGVLVMEGLVWWFEGLILDNWLILLCQITAYRIANCHLTVFLCLWDCHIGQSFWPMTNSACEMCNQAVSSSLLVGIKVFFVKHSPSHGLCQWAHVM